MRRPLSYALLFLLFCPCGFSQVALPDSQTLQALLMEVRHLREDLRTAAVAGQRAQIFIYRVQVQESVVRRIQERVDNARATLTQLQSEQKRLAADIKRLEEARNRTETSAEEKREIDETLAGSKARLEIESNSELEIQAKLPEAEDQLRVEQAKLNRLEDELDRLDKTLENLGQPSGAKQQ